jgi:Lectin C-type domain
LNDNLKDGDYYWESTGQLLGSYNYWADTNPVLGEVYNCAVLNAGNTTSINKGKWYSTNCDNEYAYICEKENLICVNNISEN